VEIRTTPIPKTSLSRVLGRVAGQRARKGQKAQKAQKARLGPKGGLARRAQKAALALQARKAEQARRAQKELVRPEWEEVRSPVLVAWAPWSEVLWLASKTTMLTRAARKRVARQSPIPPLEQPWALGPQWPAQPLALRSAPPPALSCRDSVLPLDW
jgi:hypothetical protein